MKYKICAVRDRAADVYGQPIFVAALGQAIRGFSDQINAKGDANNMLASHPEDFDLFELGEYDDEFGSFDGLERPRQLVVGKDVAKASN